MRKELMQNRIMAWNIIPRVMEWCIYIFKGNPQSLHPHERGLRFLEESLELVQTDEVGVTEEQAIQLVRYVYSRPKGETRQEIGGVGVTFANLCGCIGYDLVECTEDEMERIQRPEIVEKIRNKQVSKQLHGIGGTPVPKETGQDGGTHPSP